jgi:hypothetical protein
MLDRLPLDLARRIRDSLQRQALLGDKNYYGKVFETVHAEMPSSSARAFSGTARSAAARFSRR